MITGELKKGNNPAYITINGKLPDDNGNYPNVVTSDTDQTFTPEEQLQIRENLGITGNGVEVSQTTGTSETLVMSQKAVTDALDLKVSTEAGKGLSTNDFTTAEKTKLETLENFDATEILADITALETNKADKTDTYTKAEVDGKVVSVYKYKGAKADYTEIELLSDMVVGDVWEAQDTGENYAWDGTKWDALGNNIDLSAYALKSELPTLTSDLTNDSDFVSDANYVHTDNNYTTEEKTKLAGLENFDDTDILAELDLKQDLLTAQQLTNIDLVPNKADKIDVYLKSEVYTKAEVDDEINAKLGSVYKFKGNVNNASELDSIVNAEVGDTYNSLDTGDNYSWDGTKWDKLSGTVDLSAYALKTELPTLTSELTNDSNFAVDASYVHTDNNYTTEEKTKLGTIEESANNYVLTQATETEFGGIKAVAKTDEETDEVKIGTDGKLYVKPSSSGGSVEDTPLVKYNNWQNTFNRALMSTNTIDKDIIIFSNGAMSGVDGDLEDDKFITKFKEMLETYSAYDDKIVSVIDSSVANTNMTIDEYWNNLSPALTGKTGCPVFMMFDILFVTRDLDYLEVFTTNFNTIIQNVVASGNIPVVLSNIPTDNQSYPNFNDTVQLHNVLKNLCEYNECKYIDVFTSLMQIVNNGTYHPSEIRYSSFGFRVVGAKLVADIIAKDILNISDVYENSSMSAHGYQNAVPLLPVSNTIIGTQHGVSADPFGGSVFVELGTADNIVYGKGIKMFFYADAEYDCKISYQLDDYRGAERGGMLINDTMLEVNYYRAGETDTLSFKSRVGINHVEIRNTFNPAGYSNTDNRRSYIAGIVVDTNRVIL